MFTPQFYLYEQVKQHQTEMERMAQQDLAISLAGNDPVTPHGGIHLFLLRLETVLQSWTNISAPDFTQKASNYSLKIEKRQGIAQVKLQ